MQRHAFRSVCSRARPELEQASEALQSCIRQFSTTQLQAADQPPRPSVQERRRTAASQVNSLARDRSTSQNGQPGQAKVIDVKKLPLTPRIRGLRGGFAGRGGRGGASQSGPGRAPGQNARGGSVRGGRGGRGRGRGGAARGRRSGKDGEKKDRDDKGRGRTGGEFNQMSPEEEAFDRDLRFGVPTPYVQPPVTLDSLAEFAPAFPSSTMGKAAAVQENLGVLGTADPVGAPMEFQARHLAADVENNGIRFFADLQSKEAAEQYLREKKPAAEGEDANAPLIAGAEEAVRQAILKRAVQGQYEAPKFTDDTVAIARSWHLRAETYTTKDVNSFEKKVQELLAKGATKPKAKGAKKQAKA